MRPNTVVSAIVVFTFLPINQLALADDSAIGAMAEILISLNHFPSDSDKQRLSEIADNSDSSKAEISVATAIANIEHRAKAADKDKLTVIVADESASSQLRDLASVVLALNHTPSATDVAKLESIAPES